MADLVPVLIDTTSPDDDLLAVAFEKVNQNLIDMAEAINNAISPVLTFGTTAGTVCEGNDGRVLAAAIHVAEAAPHSGHAHLGQDGKVLPAELPATAGGTPTGTGFRHVTTGAEDAAAKLVVNADVDAAAAIAESKLSLAYGTAALHSGIVDAAAAASAAQGSANTAQTTASAAIPATQKGAASGVASLNASSKVVQDPANATATPAASKIPIAATDGKLDTWVSDAAPATKGKIALAGHLGGTADAPECTGLKESAGALLDMGPVADGQILRRTAGQIVGETRYVNKSYTISGGDTALVAGDVLWAPPIDVAGTIVGWTLYADAVGSIALDVRKVAYAAFPATSGNSIVASAAPSLSSAQKNTSTTLTGWTTAVAFDDVFALYVNSAATVKRVTITLKIKVS